MRRAAPLFEERLGGDKVGPAPLYFLASIYIQELKEQDRGRQILDLAIEKVDAGAFEKIPDADGLFQVATLLRLGARQEASVAWYRRAAEAFAKEKSPNVLSQAEALDQAARGSLQEEDFPEAAALLIRRLALPGVSQAERFRAGVVMVRAREYERALDALAGLSDEPFVTEANYVRRVIERYLAAGKPALDSSLTDEALVDAIRESGLALSTVRKREDEAATAAREAAQAAAEPPPQKKYRSRKEFLDAQRKALADAEKEKWSPADPNNPTQEEQLRLKFGIIASPVPPAPPSAERIAAEKEFFKYMIDLLHRGHLLREFAMREGLASLIFR